MGCYNDIGNKQNINFLKENKCPLCGNFIFIDNHFRLEKDTFDYNCLTCLPTGDYITITGTMFGTYLYEKICLNGNLNDMAKRLLNEKKGEFRILSTFDFRE